MEGSQVLSQKHIEQVVAFVKEQNQCALCSKPLVLKHIITTEAQTIKEEAYCSCCEVRARDKIFTLH